MAEIKCPFCENIIDRESFADWVKQWSEEQWGSPEWRCFLIGELEELPKLREKLAEIEPLCEKQALYIKQLERQLELLQKTLDLAEKFAPRPIFMPSEGGKIIG